MTEPALFLQGMRCLDLVMNIDSPRRTPHYFGRRMFKRELGVSRLLDFDHERHSPLGLRKGKGFPVYLCEMASMYLKSPSGRRSTTWPRSLASRYGSWKSTMESETRGSRRVFFALSEPSPVQLRMQSSQRSGLRTAVPANGRKRNRTSVHRFGSFTLVISSRMRANQWLNQYVTFFLCLARGV